MSSSNSEGCGCLIIGFVILVIFSTVRNCTDKHASAPVVSQPSTGYVAPSYSSGSSTNYSPTRAEPYGTLQSGGRNNSDTQLILKNDLSDPAYVKVINSNGQVCATLYLRSNESYKLGVDPGNYKIKYVSGPSSEWRGTTHFFGLSSTFFSGNTSYIGYGDILTLTFIKSYSRNGSGSNLQKISEDEF